MTSFDFNRLKRVVEEHDELVDFIDAQLEQLTNGDSRGSWNYTIEILADDTISIGFDDRWDDHETVSLSWDELMDSSGEKFRARQIEERRKQEEETQRRMRAIDLLQLKTARATVARLEAKHPDA